MNWYSTDNRSLHVPLSDIPEVAYAEFHDELAARLGESVLTVLRTLTDFEARGLAERLPDGRYCATRAYVLGQNRGT